MTIQACEMLLYQGKCWKMYSTPLEAYFETIMPRPDGLHCHTALERGYVGTWEIVDGKLYLIGLDGYFFGRTNSLGQGEALTVEGVFPGAGGRVFADWFSGFLRLPRGRVLAKTMIGFPLHEEELRVCMEHGVDQGCEVIRNLPPASTAANSAPGYAGVPGFLLREEQDTWSPPLAGMAGDDA